MLRTLSTLLNCTPAPSGVNKHNSRKGRPNPGDEYLAEAQPPRRRTCLHGTGLAHAPRPACRGRRAACGPSLPTPPFTAPHCLVALPERRSPRASGGSTSPAAARRSAPCRPPGRTAVRNGVRSPASPGTCSQTPPDSYRRSVTKGQTLPIFPQLTPKSAPNWNLVTLG